MHLDPARVGFIVVTFSSLARAACRDRTSPQARQAYVAPPIARPLLTPEQAANVDRRSERGVREAAAEPSAQAPREYRGWHPQPKIGPWSNRVKSGNRPRISSVPTGGRERAPGARPS